MDFYSEYANLPFVNPPPGVVSNFDNPPSRALDMYIGMGTCTAVSMLFFALRMYAKLIVTHTPGWDDCETHLSIIIRRLTAIVACSIGLVGDIALSAYFRFSHHDVGTFCRPYSDNICQ